MTKNYDDIINLPHHQSPYRAHMSLHDRAAQFAPFAALTGYDASINEAARLTDDEIELSDYHADILDFKFNNILEHVDEYPEVSVVYFEKDERKSGGAYLSYSGKIKKIDLFERIIVFTDGTKIYMDCINDIDEITG
ncbi:MAG: hypothetical protein Q4C42_03185 [Clostridia bacterium]|nr:hypothetical protein [Clostridia bacterium]